MRNNLCRGLICFLAWFIAASPARADRYVELEYSHSALTSGFGVWNDVNILNYFDFMGDQAIVETDYKNHFGESAAVLGATLTHNYNLYWYQDFSLSFSTDSAIIPGFVAYSEIHRKFLADQSLVGGVGLGYNISQEPYTDLYGLIEASYYFNGDISVQAGTRLNQSSPGSVFTARGFGSLNFVYHKFENVLRFEAGREGYSVVGLNTFRNEFSSKEELLQTRFWFTSGLGLGARVSFYQSDFYDRSEVALDLLWRY